MDAEAHQATADRAAGDVAARRAAFACPRIASDQAVTTLLRHARSATERRSTASPGLRDRLSCCWPPLDLDTSTAWAPGARHRHVVRRQATGDDPWRRWRPATQ